MSLPQTDDTAELRQSLWLLIVSPIIWALHFLWSYITAAIWCAKFAPSNGALGGVRLAILLYTVVALGAIAWNGLGGLRRHRHGPGTTHEFDSPADRHRFLGFATLLLAGLSAVAVLFAGGVVLFFTDCR